MAAEWSIAPSYSASADYDSNRRLAVDGKGSGASVLAVDLLFKRAMEDTQFTIEPRYAYRRFTDPSLGNGDDRSVNAGFNWLGEQSTVSLTASYWDQSTLLTELLETGIVSADTHRRMSQAGANWIWNQTERRALITQFSWMDVKYYGGAESELPGYKYPSLSVGERFYFNERGSFTVSAYGSVLQSQTRGNSSHEAGLRGEFIHAFSERTNLDASIGESSRDLAGKSSRGTDASVTLSRTLFTGKLSLGYNRSLVPYGFGFLVERQLYSVDFSHGLTPFLDATVSALRIQNNETAVLLRLDRRNYNSLTAGLHWHPTETWSVGATIAGIRTQTPDFAGETVSGWHSYINLTWTPLPTSRSR